MKKMVLLVTCFACTLILGALNLSSPNNQLKLSTEINDGQLYYELFLNNKAIILPSRLGLELKNKENLNTNFTLLHSSNSTNKSEWHPVLGQYETIKNHYNELSIELIQKKTNYHLIIRFRLYNEGLAFRYEFPHQLELDYFEITKESTEFRLNGDHKTFWIPSNFDSNEFIYNTTPLTKIDGNKASKKGIAFTHFDRLAVQTPLLMKTKHGDFIEIFEAAVSNYPTMHLNLNPNKRCFTPRFAPNAVGSAAFMQTPCHTPWRTVFACSNAKQLLASQMIYNLNEPCKLEETKWIKPVKYIGIWWEMHVPNRSSWNYSDANNTKIDQTDYHQLTPNGRHGATTENTKRYIDFAAKYGFDAVLIEGWNIGWEDWAWKWKENVFDFVTPYPDFNVDSVVNYAQSKGIDLIMHHETSGSATNYERRLDSAIRFMKENQYHSVKTGYVGRIIPRGEYHCGQWMVNHYERIAQKMAENKLLLDSHESARPTGQSRTYPNWLAAEAARGNEFNAWSEGNPPEHETILPFTRVMGGGMDYTPGIFQIKMSHYDSKNKYQVHTTLAKQLALYITMYSPLQMAADLPENYEQHLDAFQFIQDVACDWKDTKILEAEPGDYITIARQAKHTNQWFIGGITDENKRTAHVNCNFLEKGKKYIATIYSDTKKSDWEKNPMAYKIYTKQVTYKTKLKIKEAPGGGFAISFKEITN